MRMIYRRHIHNVREKELIRLFISLANFRKSSLFIQKDKIYDFQISMFKHLIYRRDMTD